MNLSTRIAAGATAAAMVSLFGIAATPANAAPFRADLVTAPTAAVTGTLEGRAFTGQMSNLTASVVNGTATLSGSIKGTGLPAAGTTFTTAVDSVTVPVSDPVTVPVSDPVTVPVPDPVTVPVPDPVTVPVPDPVTVPVPDPVTVPV